MDPHKYTALFEAPGGKPVLHAYPDPLTKGDPHTIGLGHTGSDVKPGDVWTEERCMVAFYNDYSVASAAATHVIGVSCWATLNEVRRAVLADLAFNIGPQRLAGFHNMLDAVRASKWQKAHDELLDSAYAGQVHGRATKNAQALLTGEWP